MIPPFERDGNLPPGIHWATWQEVVERFGTNRHRRRLLKGLEQALKALRRANCPTVYLNGSFVTAKADPNDYDVAWEMNGFDVTKLDSVFSDFTHKRAAQKQKYGGEFFPVIASDTNVRRNYLELFQTDEETLRRKGIVAIDLGGIE